MGGDDVLQQDEANPVGRARQEHHPIEYSRHLHHRKELLKLIGVLSLDQKRNVEALVVDVREWVTRIYRQWGKHGIDAAGEELVDVGSLRR